MFKPLIPITLFSALIIGCNKDNSKESPLPETSQSGEIPDSKDESSKTIEENSNESSIEGTAEKAPAAAPLNNSPLDASGTNDLTPTKDKANFEPASTEVTKPVGTDTEVTKPVDTDTEVTKPVGTDTEVTKPVGTDTEVTKPVDTNTEVTKPVDTNTEVTKPVSNQPSPSEPIAPEPKIVTICKTKKGTFEEIAAVEALLKSQFNPTCDMLAERLSDKSNSSLYFEDAISKNNFPLLKLLLEHYRDFPDMELDIYLRSLDRSLRAEKMEAFTLVFDAARKKLESMSSDQTATLFMNILTSSIATDAFKKVLSLENIDLNATKEWQCTAVYFAISWKKTDLAEILLADNRVSLDPKHNEKRCLGGNYHLAAVRSGDIELLKAVLARPESKVSISGFENPLREAISLNRPDMLALLLGAPEVEINAVMNGHTYLTKAIEGNIEPIIDLLLAQPEIDVNSKFEGMLYSPLGTAIKGGFLEIVEKLLKLPQVDPNAHASMYDSPLLLAASEGKADIVARLLRDERVDRNYVNPEYKKNFLHAAVSGGLTELALELIKDGFNVNQADRYGWTPLANAIVRGQPKTALALLKVPGIQPMSVEFEYGRNPLHWAAYYGQKEVVQALLATGLFRTDATDQQSLKPADLASRRRHRDIVTILENFQNPKRTYTFGLTGAIESSFACVENHVVEHKESLLQDANSFFTQVESCNLNQYNSICVYASLSKLPRSQRGRITYYRGTSCLDQGEVKFQSTEEAVAYIKANAYAGDD